MSMDPFTSACNLFTAYINFAAVQFAATPPAQQEALAAIHARMLTDLFNFVVKVHDDLHAGIDKLKAKVG